jgi:hypothetical protein
MREMNGSRRRTVAEDAQSAFSNYEGRTDDKM